MRRRAPSSPSFRQGKGAFTRFCLRPGRLLGATAAFLCASLALTAPRPASADETPTIQIRESGALEPYPLGKAFRIEGDRGDYEQVDLVLIRSAYKAFGVLDPSALDCSKVVEKLTVKGRFPSFSDNAPIGATEVSKLWRGADRLLGADFDAYRPAPWKKGDKPDGKFTLSVPADSFFRAGAQFCSLLLRQNKPPLVVQSVDKAFSAFVDGWAACSVKAPLPTAPSCEEVTRAFKQSLGDQLGGEKLSAEEQGRLDATVNKLKSSLLDARDARDALQKIATAWSSAYVSKVATPEEALHYFDVQRDDLGKLLAAVLARHHVLLASPIIEKPAKAGEKSTTRLAYFTDEASFEVVEIGFTEKLDKIIVRGKDTIVPAAKPTAATKGEPARPKDGPRVTALLSVGPSALGLPGTDLKLIDLLHFSRGRIRIDSAYLTPTEALQQKLADKLKWNALEVSQADVEAVVVPTVTWLRGIQTLLAAASPGDPGRARSGSPPDPGAGIVHRSMGGFLAGVLQPCSAMAPELRGSECAAAKAKPSEISTVWPGFAETNVPSTGEPFVPAEVGPVSYLESMLTQYLDGKRAALAARDTLKDAAGLRRTQVATSSAQRMELTSGSWFGQYVVTTVGFARVTGAADPFWVNYYGFKIYPFPNRIDEPKWLGSPAPYRLLALELAFVPNLQALEAAPRFNGLQKGAIPPIMLGASLQALPYLTISGGAIFMENRHTVLDKETSASFISPYLGIAADVNILDAVATGLQKGRSTTISGVIH